MGMVEQDLAGQSRPEHPIVGAVQQIIFIGRSGIHQIEARRVNHDMTGGARTAAAAQRKKVVDAARTDGFEQRHPRVS